MRNFESLNPANTYWEKPYNLYSKVDTEAQRFLEFETWWGSPVLLNAGEMQWIADNLFVGNKLTSGEIRTSDGVRVDLRNIRSPIIVLCSWGDNITPPQQALGWITDLYGHEDEIVANGQTIVYTLHQTIGHLGIFVSGKVATKEHAEFASCMEMIDLMPPGLYEAVITEVDEDTANPELIHGKYLFRLEARTLDDIRALGANSDEDNQRFATVARVSEVNHGLYRALAQPAVRAMTTEQSAEMARQLHPNRLRFTMFSDKNPMMQPVKALAGAGARRSQAGCARQSAADDGARGLDLDHDLVGRLPAGARCHDRGDVPGHLRLAAAAGDGRAGHPACADRSAHRPRPPARGDEARMRAELERRFEVGGLPQAVLRALIYVRLPERSVDERGFTALQAIRAMQPVNDRMSMAELKACLRNSFCSSASMRSAPCGPSPGCCPTASTRAEPRSTPCCRCSARAAPCRPRACGAWAGSRRCSASRARLRLEGGQCLTTPHPPPGRTTSTSG